MNMRRRFYKPADMSQTMTNKVDKSYYIKLLEDVNDDDIIDMKPEAIAALLDIFKCILLDWLKGKFNDN